MASKIEKAVQQMEAWANDDSHGYAQDNRWGPDYDCSSSIIQALENAGIPAKSNGATYTGNMYNVLLGLGFKDVTKEVDMVNGLGIIRGDILLNHVNHVAMCTGINQLVQASINELGTVSGGQPGDQTGKEFYIRSYYNYPWDCVLRYAGTEFGANTGQIRAPENASIKSDAGIGRITKESKCFVDANGTKQSTIIPKLPESMPVNIISYGNKYSLIGFYTIPNGEYYKEYILTKNIKIF